MKNILKTLVANYIVESIKYENQYTNDYIEEDITLSYSDDGEESIVYFGIFFKNHSIFHISELKFDDLTIVFEKDSVTIKYQDMRMYLSVASK